MAFTSMAVKCSYSFCRQAMLLVPYCLGVKVKSISMSNAAAQESFSSSLVQVCANLQPHLQVWKVIKKWIKCLCWINASNKTSRQVNNNVQYLSSFLLCRIWKFTAGMRRRKAILIFNESTVSISLRTILHKEKMKIIIKYFHYKDAMYQHVYYSLKLVNFWRWFLLIRLMIKSDKIEPHSELHFTHRGMWHS